MILHCFQRVHKSFKNGLSSNDHCDFLDYMRIFQWWTPLYCFRTYLVTTILKNHSENTGNRQISKCRYLKILTFSSDSFWARSYHRSHLVTYFWKIRNSSGREWFCSLSRAEKLWRDLPVFLTGIHFVPDVEIKSSRRRRRQTLFLVMIVRFVTNFNCLKTHFPL